MWKRVNSKVYQGVTAAAVWQTWTDVNNWHQWDTDLEYCQLQGDFVVGKQFILKPKGGPKVNITLSKIETNKHFTDYCKFLGATMYDAHDLEQTPEGLRITHTTTVVGSLTFLWVLLVAKKVANSIPEQTNRLVEYARGKYV